MKVINYVVNVYALSLILSASAFSGSVAQSFQATHFFKTYCVGTLQATTERRHSEAQKAHLHQLDKKYENNILKGESGSVWKLDDETGVYFLIFRSLSDCEVWAKELDEGSVYINFLDVLQTLRLGGQVVEDLPIRHTLIEGRPVDFYDFKVHERDSKFGYLYRLLLSSRSNDKQAVLSVEKYSD